MPEARIYVVGGVARGGTTVLSDIDVLVVVPRGTGRHNLARRILEKAISDHGLPWDAPVEIHVVEEGGEGSYTKEGCIDITPCTGR